MIPPVAGSDRPRIDMHVHVGVLGDTPEYRPFGRVSDHLRASITFKVFLAYAKVPQGQVSDPKLEEILLKTIAECGLDKVVCLALDPVYDDGGSRREDLSNLWVDNRYVLRLRDKCPKVLLGASVHPYDVGFERRVAESVGDGAVLLKWLPSSQQINLADDRVAKAMRFLAKAGPSGRPLPLLLHCGVEYAIPTTDPRTFSYDFLSWSFWDGLGNRLRSKGKQWHVPNLTAIRRNLDAALEAGAVIIFAHCGLPYFAPRLLRGIEHDDLPVVREYLRRPPTQKGGRAYADVSAILSPFRKTYFKELHQLPADRLVVGSDYPVPMFELSADLEEHWDDFKAVLGGHLDRIVIPEDNLLDVNERELRAEFPGHPMFGNFAKILP